LLLALCASAAILVRLYKPFPPDTSPEGAYLRIAKHIARDEPREIFPYLETEAQWAAYTSHDARKASIACIRKDYPEADQARALANAGNLQASEPLKDGEESFVQTAKAKGWVTRLRKDLSGVASVEIVGERATVVTARGTRYPFRKRENGIWGLTIFTAELLTESERASRDLDAIRKAAEDYARIKNKAP
jgi:hypothetical protein